jgi:glycerol-3-phosphate acyltransferase PlsY
MFPVLLLTLFPTPSLLFKIFAIAVAIAVVATHSKNIRRLVQGEEKRFLKRKKG